LLAVLAERQGDAWQGGVWTFPPRFASGIMRARFNPRDGQLYVGGLKGWQTSAPRDGAFQRVRYTGRPVEMPTGLHVYTNGVELTFSEELNRASAADPQNYSAEMWNYRWAAKYGSDDFSVSHPDQKGRDALAVAAAQVSPSGKSVFLAIPGLKPVMQMRVRYNIETAAGHALNQEIDNTINFLRAGVPKWN
jgi:hypothetical protein